MTKGTFYTQNHSQLPAQPMASAFSQQKLAGAGHTVLLHGHSEQKLADASLSVGGTNENDKTDLATMENLKALANNILAKHKDRTFSSTMITVSSQSPTLQPLNRTML